MKLAAIYNFWDGAELIEKSILSIRNCVDMVIVVVSTFDDAKKKYDNEAWNFCQRTNLIDIVLKREPVFYKKAQNQIYKRQQGLFEAIKNKCTHFLFIDSDEFYIESEFLSAKRYIIENNIKASVCNIYTYFKEPTLRFRNFDKTCHVPFIHEIKNGHVIGNNERKYLPYVVDFGRNVNTKTKPVLLDMVNMHHFSWVRKDIMKKVISHASYDLIIKNNILEDYKNAEEGYFVRHYQDELIRVDNIFNINF